MGFAASQPLGAIGAWRVPCAVAALAAAAFVVAAVWAGFARGPPGNARLAAAMEIWDGSAAFTARVVGHCPTTAVHIDPELVNGQTMARPPADNRAVVWGAYRSVAARHGFALEPAQSRRIPDDCPALIWGEHDALRSLTAARVLAHERARGLALDRLWLYRLGNGWVASDRPLAVR